MPDGCQIHDLFAIRCKGAVTCSLWALWVVVDGVQSRPVPQFPRHGKAWPALPRLLADTSTPATHALSVVEPCSVMWPGMHFWTSWCQCQLVTRSCREQKDTHAKTTL
ncbi:hypothetical protein COO60DRAFT_1537774, partial [Scenedesmus sp. NREL 46B-D3]